MLTWAAGEGRSGSSLRRRRTDMEFGRPRGRGLGFRGEIFSPRGSGNL